MCDIKIITCWTIDQEQFKLIVQVIFDLKIEQNIS